MNFDDTVLRFVLVRPYGVAKINCFQDKSGRDDKED